MKCKIQVLYPKLNIVTLLYHILKNRHNHIKSFFFYLWIHQINFNTHIKIQPNWEFIKMLLGICLDPTYGVCVSSLRVFSLFFFSQLQLLTILPWIVHLCTVHGSHKHHFSVTFSLKMGSTTLFTHLEIILLQCF